MSRRNQEEEQRESRKVVLALKSVRMGLSYLFGLLDRLLPFRSESEAFPGMSRVAEVHDRYARGLNPRAFDPGSDSFSFP